MSSHRNHKCFNTSGGVRLRPSKSGLRSISSSGVTLRSVKVMGTFLRS